MSGVMKVKKMIDSKTFQPYLELEFPGIKMPFELVHDQAPTEEEIELFIMQQVLDQFRAWKYLEKIKANSSDENKE